MPTAIVKTDQSKVRVLVYETHERAFEEAVLLARRHTRKSTPALRRMLRRGYFIAEGGYELVLAEAEDMRAMPAKGS